MAMMTIPLVFVDLTPERISVAENRMLAERPELADIRNHPGKFIRQFEDWLKDSTGFREQIIKLYNFMDNNWINSFVRYKSGQYVYLIGEKGHRYFADVDGKLIKKFQGKPFFSDELLASMANKIEETKIFLDSKNIPMIVMFCTDKESIYPEFYPKSIKKGPDPIQLEIITDYIRDNTSVDVFNIRHILLKEKNNFLMYPVSSSGDLTHYTEIAAFFAYYELMQHINIYFPQLVPYELSDIEISYDKKGIPHVSLKVEITSKKLDSSFFDDVELSRPFSWHNQVYENIESGLPTLLVFRDSYINEDTGGKLLAQHFSKTIFIHYENIWKFEEYVTKYNPDIVVFESAERALDGFAYMISGIPVTKITAELTIAKDIEELKQSTYDIISIDIKNNNIILYTGKNDPMLYISINPVLDKPSETSFISIEYTNSNAGHLQVFYDYGNDLSEVNSSHAFIDAVYNEATIRLPIIGWNEGEQLVRIRIDPPDNTEFMIKNVKIIYF